jgi:hypothetical protein
MVCGTGVEGSALLILVVVEELASKEKTQAPPAWVVWDALADPGHPGSSAWLDLADGEVAPQVLEASRPTLVVWSSLWPDRSHDQVRFELRPKDGGCAVRWRLLSPDAAPPAEVIKHRRHRLDFLINGKLRATFDLCRTQGQPRSRYGSAGHRGLSSDRRACCGAGAGRHILGLRSRRGGPASAACMRRRPGCSAGGIAGGKHLNWSDAAGG